MKDYLQDKFKDKSKDSESVSLDKRTVEQAYQIIVKDRKTQKIYKLNAGTAPGTDGIMAKHLKLEFKEVSPCKG